MSLLPTAAPKLRPKLRMSDFVLDASTVIAIFNEEVGGQDAADLIAPGCFLSTVNLAEVVAVLRHSGWLEDEIEQQLEAFDIQIVEFSRSHALDAGFLRSVTRSKGLSLGDRACLAVARELRLPALTGDRRWEGLDVGVEMRIFR